jgi:hypothetical protein
MSPVALLLLLLVLSPILMFVAHAIAFRAMGRIGAAPSAHSSAFVALAAAFVAVFLVAWQLGAFDTSQGLATALCGVAYVAFVYGALAILYIDVVNIAETSLHMHLLLELAWTGGVPMADLLERYSADRMIAARLERLTSLGQVRVTGDRCYVGNRSTLRVAGAIDAWRVVLGLPTTPSSMPKEAPAQAVRHSGR